MELSIIMEPTFASLESIPILLKLVVFIPNITAVDESSATFDNSIFWPSSKLAGDAFELRENSFEND